MERKCGRSAAVLREDIQVNKAASESRLATFSSLSPNNVRSKNERNSVSNIESLICSATSIGREEPPGCKDIVCGHFPARKPIKCMNFARAGNISAVALPLTDLNLARACANHVLSW